MKTIATTRIPSARLPAGLTLHVLAGLGLLAAALTLLASQLGWIDIAAIAATF